MLIIENVNVREIYIEKNYIEKKRIKQGITPALFLPTYRKRLYYCSLCAETSKQRHNYHSHVTKVEKNIKQ